jgi:replicative DNA helicase
MLLMSEVESPMLPQALDAEEALLGSILIDYEALLIAKILTPTDFYRDAHATIFATMRQLEEDGLAVDSVTVTTRLERTGQLEQAGGASFVLGLVNTVPTLQNARYYADLVKKASEGR